MNRSFRYVLFVLFVIGSLLLSPATGISAQGSNPKLILTKSVDGNVTNVKVGDIIHYRIRFECSSLTTSCGEMEITDVLPAGVTYLAAESYVPAGFTITYNNGTRTVTIRKIDNDLLDGTQYDAVIAVSVNYDLRPLPAALNNTANGTIDPPGPVGVQVSDPAPAPPITVGTLNLNWDLTKTQVSPGINPTVDTNVTYAIRFCPTGVSGNAAMSDITLTDTLPAGAVFVSASDGGTESGGVVTWTAAGPVVPPDCLTRYVTVRYPSATFGNPTPPTYPTVTNSASVSAGYVGNTGWCAAPCFTDTDSITHPIIEIHDAPTFSKSDTGDPVGMSGTARFLLELNTNGTNWPSNNVTLIDNLPGELQVTEVTSGTWDASFNYVRAYVEYSTDLGATWTAFPGVQPIQYNTNATYTAPVPNVTNVRWRFEYDDPISGTPNIPGLPYMWSFSARPEIRVTPRATATTADDSPPTALNAATAGSTYTNCLQITYDDSHGNPVSPACANEDMTVRGDVVSLRVSKAETPGEAWDDLYDPNINTFVADSSIMPGDTLKYTLTVEMTERSSTNLINPIIHDTLPNDLVFVRFGNAQLNGGALPGGASVAANQTGPNPGAGNNLTWTFSGLNVAPQQFQSNFLTVEFYARIPRGQGPGQRTNTMSVDTGAVDAVCEIPNGSNTDNHCVNTDNYEVERTAALRGEKWIRSVAATNSQVVDSATFLPDASCPNGGNVGLPGSSNDFTRYPCIAQAFPEGALAPNQHVGPTTDPTLDDFEYNLRVFNDGNVPMIHYALYDLLPRYGDTGSGGTLYGASRSSEFRPALTGPVQFLSAPAPLSAADFTIEYSVSLNPCRPEVFNQAPATPNVPAGCTNDWVPAASISNWTTVRAYRILMKPASGGILSGGEARFGVPMHIVADADPIGTVTQDDPFSKEIAWNSFSHVGSYTDLSSNIRDLLASEPRKVGITIPERFSIGNRVWRDSDNSGTINAPDDANPGINGVLVNLYLDADNDGIPDGARIAQTTTSGNGTQDGYYLFSNLPAGNYVVGIDANNFNSGQPLYHLRSSTGTPANPIYTSPTDNDVDSADHGIDTAAPFTGEVFSPTITLSANAEPKNESDLSTDAAHGLPGARRGLNGERDENSNLTVDFGFFGGSDVPFSIGNHLWYDNGAGANLNNGLRDTDELPVVGVRVELYRDGNGNHQPDPSERIRFDVTDANGFYLFDNLDPGEYYVVIPSGNFGDANFDVDGSGPLPAAPGVLRGWFSSQFTDTDEQNGGDNNDNGINNDQPWLNGIRSGPVILTRGVDEPTGETYLSGDTSTAPGFDPTAGDGPGSIGRFGETDQTSNLTIDFGFIPPMSLGNRVWIDDGAGEPSFRAGYNNGIQDGTEAGRSGVTVELYRSDGSGVRTGPVLDTTTTDAQGYYLFERLQPGDYVVYIPPSNFTGGGRLVNYISSYDRTAPTDNAVDKNDNGIDNANPATDGVVSNKITMAYRTEPLTPGDETDLPAGYGPGHRGNYGQADDDSNLTVDFGFVQAPHSIGNRLWYDLNNNGVIDGGELPVVNARVSLYRDSDGNGVPDGPSIATDVTDAGGYYLFDNLPPGRYLVGVDNWNFQSGGPLEGYASSTGGSPAPTSPDYVNPPTSNANQSDHGRDRILPGDPVVSPYGVLSSIIDMRTTSPTSDEAAGTVSADTGTALGFNPTEDDGPNSRGRYGETNDHSNLAIDFGFFKPMSLGNRVWKDDGAGGGVLNDGIMNGGELPFANVRVELYRDNGDGNFGAGDTLVAYDITDANGYYLFDELTPGNYFVRIPSSNFNGAGALTGWYSSGPTFADNADVNDNGVNNAHPEVNGITSNLITLANDSAPTGETQLSGDTTLGNASNSPTNWDGPDSRGRYGETDNNSNLTVDFGFIPPLSLGNRVWIDDGATLGGPVLSQYNNGIHDGTELGRTGVIVNLYYDANGDGDYNDVVDGVNEAVPYRTTTTDANGYYLFDGLPEGKYYVQIAPSNFAGGGALNGYVSSTGSTDNETGDLNDNGQDSPTYLADGIRSMDVVLAYNGEPTDETDISGDTTAYGPDGWGRYGESNASSNLTIDFGFIQPPHSLGNRLWYDVNNNGVDDAENPVVGASVSLYRDANNDGVPDGPAIATTTTDASGFYLFDNLPPGRYIVGVNSSNFQSGGPLEGYASSTGGTPSNSIYTNPPATNPDRTDHGIDVITPAASTHGILSPSIDLTGTSPTGEDTGTKGIGTHGETDATSDLTVDFGFYQPMSLGNRVWRDDGGTTGTLNDGIMNGDEQPIAGVRVELYRDNGDGNFGTGDTLVAYDVTDANGYYLFDGLTPGNYFVHITNTNFQASGPLQYWYSSGPTFADNADVNDNGVNNARPEVNGITSNLITLANNSAPTGETQLSGDTTPGNANNNPTNWDGPVSRGRYGETDNNSNLTVDFGFVPPMSVGNRVWIDDGINGGSVDVSLYDNGIQDGTELGRAGVTVNLYYDLDGNGTIDASEMATPYRATTTDANGYYLFDGLPEGKYYVQIAPSNFASGGALDGYVSSTGSSSDKTIDRNDNGIDDAAPATNGIRSADFTLVQGGEPTGETDLSGNPAHGSDSRGTHGETNANSNLTIDFGFIQPTHSLGNRLWYDVNNNGIDDAGELPVANANVSLYWDANGDGIPDGPAIKTTTTDSNGYYLFDNLPSGRYLVGVDSSNFVSGGPLYEYSSSTGATHGTDQRDNGIDVAGDISINSPTYGILSSAVDLTGTSPTGETVSGNPAHGPDGRGNYGESDEHSDLTVDFGFVKLYSLGNRVWFDTDNSHTINGGEVGINNVTVQLYASDLSGAPTGPVLGTATTASGGYYRFDNLIAGDYVVVLPNSNFTTGGALVGYWSSGTSIDASGILADGYARNPEGADTNTDSLDNGASTFTNGGDLKAGGALQSVSSGKVTLGDYEPITDADYPSPDPAGEAINNHSNRTVDFGFYTASLGDLVFIDVDEDGMFNPNPGSVDLPLPGATVELLDKNGDVIATTTSDGTGNYVFENLPDGEYKVRVTPPSGYSSTKDNADTSTPNNYDNNNDNGVGTAAGAATSETMELKPGVPRPGNPADNAIVIDDAHGSTYNPTLDFGFIFNTTGGSTINPTKTLIATDQVHTVNPNVTIGEILTYQITIPVPYGTLTDVSVVDTPDSGLAFVDCVSVTIDPDIASVPSTAQPAYTGFCDDGVTSGTHNPLIENNGGKATFYFGDLDNTATDHAPRLITIQYQMIVLDIAANSNGVQRTNSAVWTYSGQHKTVEAPKVKIVEPSMDVVKDATPKIADYGTAITFTMDVEHTAQSTAHAYDVEINDPIPAGFAYIPGSAVVTGTTSGSVITFDAVTNTLTVFWDEFNLGEKARITFKATFIGPAPVNNTTWLEWTSLPIDPSVNNPWPTPDVPVPLSPYNPAGTERWYDPSNPSGVNGYGVTSSVEVKLPKKLPLTGFAPGQVTVLPEMPKDFAYAPTDFWVEIPALKLKTPIVGVPIDPKNGEWDLRWLADNIGWLDGTAYPTHSGNSLITAHSTLASGLDGPFSKLDSLRYGDQIIVHLGGQKYVYEVRSNQTVKPSAIASVMKHEEKPWLTLITCKTYDEKSAEYLNRTVVRAVLVSVSGE
ncbi:MAG: sortase [Anaerolineales bacterium]|nr:sortase [Anaerolineales bacterium]